MTHSQIAKEIFLIEYDTHPDAYWIKYFFGQKKVILNLEKDSESDLLALVEGEMCQFEALSIAIMNEVQKEAAAVAHRGTEAVNNLHPLFQGILGSYGMK